MCLKGIALLADSPQQQPTPLPPLPLASRLTRPSGTLYCTSRNAKAMGLKGSTNPAWLSCLQLPGWHSFAEASTLVGPGGSLGLAAGGAVTVMAAGRGGGGACVSGHQSQ